LLLPRFCAYFLFQTLQLLLVGRNNIFVTGRRAGYTSHATEGGQGFGKIWTSLNFFGTHFDNLRRIAKAKRRLIFGNASFA